MNENVINVYQFLDVKSKTVINRTHSLLVPADCLSPGHHVKYHKVLGFLTFECTSMYNLTRNKSINLTSSSP